MADQVVDMFGRLIGQQTGVLRDIRESLRSSIATQNKNAGDAAASAVSVKGSIDHLPEGFRKHFDPELKKTLEYLKNLSDHVDEQKKKKEQKGTDGASGPRFDMTAFGKLFDDALKKSHHADDWEVMKAGSRAMQNIWDRGSKPGSIYVHDTHAQEILIQINQDIRKLGEHLGATFEGAVKSLADLPREGAASGGAAAGAAAAASGPAGEAAATAAASANEAVDGTVEGMVRVRQLVYELSELYGQRFGNSVENVLRDMTRIGRLTENQAVDLGRALARQREQGRLTDEQAEQMARYQRSLREGIDMTSDQVRLQEAGLRAVVQTAHSAEDFDRVVQRLVQDSNKVQAAWGGIAARVAESGKNAFAYQMASMTQQMLGGVHAGLELKNVFSGIWGEQVKHNTEMRQTLYITHGLTESSDKLRNQWMQLSREASAVAQTGATMAEYQESFRAGLQSGVKDMKTLNEVTRTGLNLGKAIGADAKTTAKTIGEWTRTTGMSSNQMAQFARDVKFAASNVGLMGEELMGALQSAKELADAMRDAGNLTADAAGAFTQFSASAKKFGTEKSVKPMLDALSSSVTLFTKASDETRTLLFQAAAKVGRTDQLRSGTVMNDKSAQKDMARGMQDIFDTMAKNVAGTTNLAKMSDQQKFQLNMQMQAAYGMQLGEFKRTLDTIKEASMTYEDRLEDINKKLQTNLTVKEREALLEQKRGMMLQDSLSKLTKVDEAAKEAKSMTEVFDSVKMSQEEVRRQLTTSITSVNQALQKAGKGKDGIDASRIESALKDPAQYRELLSAINAGEQKAAVAQKAATDPVAKAVQQTNELNAKIVEHTGEMLAVLSTALGSGGVIAVAILGMLASSQVGNTLLQNVFTQLASAIFGGGTASAAASEASLAATRAQSAVVTTEAAVAQESHVAATFIDTTATNANTNSRRVGSVWGWISAAATWAWNAATAVFNIVSGGAVAVVGALAAGMMSLLATLWPILLVVALLYAAWKGLEAAGISLSDVFDGLMTFLKNLWKIVSTILNVVLWPLIQAFKYLFIAMKELFGWIGDAIATIADWIGGPSEKEGDATAAGGDGKAAVEASKDTAAGVGAMADVFTKPGSGYVHDIHSEKLLQEIAKNTGILVQIAQAAGKGGGASSGAGGGGGAGGSMKDSPGGGLPFINFKPVQDLDKSLKGVDQLPDPLMMMGKLLKMMAWLGLMGAVLALVWVLIPEIVVFTAAVLLGGLAFVLAVNAMLLGIGMAFKGIMWGLVRNADKKFAKEVDQLPDPLNFIEPLGMLLLWVAGMGLMTALLGEIAFAAATLAIFIAVAGAVFMIAVNAVFLGVGLAFKGLMFGLVKGADVGFAKDVEGLPDPLNFIEPAFQLLGWVFGMSAMVGVLGEIAFAAGLLAIYIAACGLVFMIAVNAVFLGVAIAFRGLAFGLVQGIDQQMIKDVGLLPDPSVIMEAVVVLMGWIAMMGSVVGVLTIAAILATIYGTLWFVVGGIFMIAMNLLFAGMSMTFDGLAYSLVVGLDQRLDWVYTLPDPGAVLARVMHLNWWTAAMTGEVLSALPNPIRLGLRALRWGIVGGLFVWAMNELIENIAYAFVGINLAPAYMIRGQLERMEEIPRLIDPEYVGGVLNNFRDWTVKMQNLVDTQVSLLPELATREFGWWIFTWKVGVGVIFADKMNELVDNIANAFNRLRLDSLFTVNEKVAQLDIIPQLMPIEETMDTIRRFRWWLSDMQRLIVTQVALLPDLATREMGWWIFTWKVGVGVIFAEKMNALIDSIWFAFASIRPERLFEAVKSIEVLRAIPEAMDPDDVTKVLMGFSAWSTRMQNMMDTMVDILPGVASRSFSTRRWLFWTRTWSVGVGQLFAGKMNALIDSIHGAFTSINAGRLYEAVGAIEILRTIPEAMDPKDILDVLLKFGQWSTAMQNMMDVMVDILPGVSSRSFSTKIWGFWTRTWSVGVGQLFAGKMNALIDSIAGAFTAIQPGRLMDAVHAVETLRMIPELMKPKDLNAVLEGFRVWATEMQNFISQQVDKLPQLAEQEMKVWIFTWKTSVGVIFAQRMNELIDSIASAFDRIDTGRLQRLQDSWAVLLALPPADMAQEALSSLVGWLRDMQSIVVNNYGEVKRVEARNRFVERLGRDMADIVQKVITSVLQIFDGLDTARLKGAGSKLDGSVVDDLPTSEQLSEALNAVLDWMTMVGTWVKDNFSYVIRTCYRHYAALQVTGPMMRDAIMQMVNGVASIFDGLDTGKLRGLGANFKKDVLRRLPSKEDLTATLDAVLAWMNDVTSALPGMYRKVMQVSGRNAVYIQMGVLAGQKLAEIINALRGMFDGALNTNNMQGLGRSFSARVLSSLPSKEDLTETFNEVVAWIEGTASLMDGFEKRIRQVYGQQAINLARGRMVGQIFTQMVNGLRAVFDVLKTDNLRGVGASWKKSLAEILPTPEEFEENFKLLINRIDGIALRLPRMYRQLHNAMGYLTAELRMGERLGKDFGRIVKMLVGVFDHLKTNALQGLGGNWRASVVTALPTPQQITATFADVMNWILNVAKVMPWMKGEMDRIKGYIFDRMELGKEMGEDMRQIITVLRDVFSFMNVRGLEGITRNLDASVVTRLKTPEEIRATFEELRLWVKGIADILGPNGPIESAVREMRGSLSVRVREQGARLAMSLQEVMNGVADIFRRISLQNLSGALAGFSLEMVQSLPDPAEIRKTFDELKTRLTSIVKEAIPKLRSISQELQAEIGDLVREGRVMAETFGKFIDSITMIFRNMHVEQLASAVTSSVEAMKTLASISVKSINEAFDGLTKWLKEFTVGDSAFVKKLKDTMDTDLKSVNISADVGRSDRMKEMITGVTKILSNMDVTAVADAWSTIKEGLRPGALPEKADLERAVAQIRTFVNSVGPAVRGAPAAPGADPGTTVARGTGGGGGKDSDADKAMKAMARGGERGSFYTHDIHCEAVLEGILTLLTEFFTGFTDQMAETAKREQSTDLQPVPLQQQEMPDAVAQRMATYDPGPAASSANQTMAQIAANTAATTAELKTANRTLNQILGALAGTGGGGSAPPDTAQPTEAQPRSTIDYRDMRNAYNFGARRKQVRVGR